MNNKWTDVTVVELTRFGFKALGASLIVSLLCAVPVGVIAMLIYLHSLGKF